MRNLLNFLQRNSSWFVFIFLQLICFYFIFSENSYQKSVFLNSSNQISGRVYATTSGVISFFGLRQENQDLLERNAELYSQINGLKDHLFELEGDSMKTEAFLTHLSDRYLDNNFIVARVVNNTVSYSKNTITINKGYDDGVRADMGVVSSKGIVGVVVAVSPNFAVVQSVLHPNTKFNCKILNTSTTATLVWEGGDPRYASLTYYPKHEKFQKGDTIVTSGYSGIFPEGILVGTIEDYKNQVDDNFYNLRIELSTDFSSLNNVFLLNNSTIKEKQDLENKVRDGK